MYDQVASIRKKGLKAAALTEDTRPEELSGTMITIYGAMTMTRWRDDDGAMTR